MAQIPIPRRHGYLSTHLVENRETLRRQSAMRSPGILTSITTRGIIRKPSMRPKATGGGGGAARWA